MGLFLVHCYSLSNEECANDIFVRSGGRIQEFIHKFLEVYFDD